MTSHRLILNSAIAQGLDVIGDRWTLLILREAFYGRKRFEEFRTHTGTSRSTLTRRLNALVENNILCKQTYGSHQNRFEYTFTENGFGLLNASLLALQWERQWHPPSTTPLSYQLHHTSCNNPLVPEAVCEYCKTPLILDDVTWPELDQQLNNQLGKIRSMNNQRRVRETNEPRSNSADLVDIIGDRWTLLILIAAFFGTNKYDEFIKQLGIAPGILVERLKSLVNGDIFTRCGYQQNPPRYEYKLTEKGKSVYPFIMTLRQWVVDKLPENTPTPDLIHSPCKKPLAVEVICSACNKSPQAKDIKLIAQ